MRLHALSCVAALVLFHVGCGTAQNSSTEETAVSNTNSFAKIAFEDLKKRPFGWYGSDACDSRAYFSSIVLTVKGMASQNVKLIRGSETLTPPKFGGQVHWGNHVAVQVGDSIIDPATAQGPVSVEEWKKLAGLSPTDKTYKFYRVPGSWGFVGGEFMRKVVQPALNSGKPIPQPKTVAEMPSFDYETANTAFGNMMYQLNTPAEQMNLCNQAAGLLNSLASIGKISLKIRDVYSPLPPAWPCMIQTNGSKVSVVTQ